MRTGSRIARGVVRAGVALAGVALLTGLLASCGPAATGPEEAGTDSGPICAREPVVRFVSRDILRHAPYAVLLPETIGERPSPDPVVVLCVVTVVRKDYDYLRYWSQAWLGYQEYVVRRLDHGYEVNMREGFVHVTP